MSDNFSRFRDRMKILGCPLPWRLDEEEPGSILATDSAAVFNVDFVGPYRCAATELATYIVEAMNARGGMAVPAPPEIAAALPEDRRAIMEKVALELADTLVGNGFALFVFPFLEQQEIDGLISMISNAEQSDLIAALTEWIASKRPPAPPPLDTTPLEALPIAAQWNTIADAWTHFENSVAPDGSPPVQAHMMRLAFYSGCKALLVMQSAMVAGGADETTGFMRLSSLNRELDQYVIDVMSPAAPVTNH